MQTFQFVSRRSKGGCLSLESGIGPAMQASDSRESVRESSRNRGNEDMEREMKKSKYLWIGILACGLLALSGTALAADVTLTGYNSFYVLDASDGTVDGVYNVIGDLTLDSTASINCNDNAVDQPPGPVAGNAS